jgi:hypothetical protein
MGKTKISNNFIEIDFNMISVWQHKNLQIHNTSWPADIFFFIINLSIHLLPEPITVTLECGRCFTNPVCQPRNRKKILPHLSLLATDLGEPAWEPPWAAALAGERLDIRFLFLQWTSKQYLPITIDAVSIVSSEIHLS